MKQGETNNNGNGQPKLDKKESQNSSSSSSSSFKASPPTKIIASKQAIIPHVLFDSKQSIPGSGKILIVDDERFNCDIIDGFLMILGFADRDNMREFAYNGEQAFNAVRKAMEEDNPYKYSLILMDCNMPFMDGYQATNKIRSLYQSNDIAKELQPKIIAITGHVEDEYVQKAYKSGMDFVYPKPLPIQEFGQLLINMKLIQQVPDHLRLDSNED